MNQQNARTRRAGATGVKALIGAAAVAATIAGWALLPANDPPTSAAAAGATGGPTELNVPGTTATNPFGGNSDTQTQVQPQTNPTQPQFSTPRGFGRQAQPFTRSHSSR